MELHKQYWENRWQENATGWDIGYASPPITSFIDTIEDKNKKILIPGCGNAHEAAYLLEYGFNNVTILDISETLTATLSERYRDTSLNVVCEDFFVHSGQYDIILEQTFFCAINPRRRSEYAKHTAELLKEKGILAGLLFDKTFDKEGPPFGGDWEEYNEYFKDFFEIKNVNKCDNSIEPRKGSEIFIQLIKK